LKRVHIKNKETSTTNQETQTSDLSDVGSAVRGRGCKWSIYRLIWLGLG